MRMEKNLVNKKQGISNEISEGGGGVPLIDVTYAELVTLIGDSELVEGQQYRITDYATKHYIVDGDNTQYTTGDGIVTGVTEPLIVMAVGVNEIHAEVKSELYPEDIIHYDWNPDNWLNDLSFGYDDGGGLDIITGWKGVIISRHDTLRQLNAPSDWRNCLTRRWETAANAWDSGTTYAFGDIVSHAATLKVYKSFAGSNLNHEPTGVDDDYWVVMLDLTTYTYWNASPISWNNIPSGASYDDFLLFNEYCRNVDIERTVYDGDLPFTIPNSVFFANSNDNRIEHKFLYNTIISLAGSEIGEEFCNNIINGISYSTIGARFKNNTIGSDFTYNTIGSYFIDNTIGSDFTYNSIGSGFTYNTIGSDFSSNTIGSDFSGNTIGSYFIKNTIGSDFTENTIGSDFTHNTIGSYFTENTIGSDFTHNTIGSRFSSNTIGSGFTYNTIGSDFTYNTIGSDFSANTIGSSFGGNTIPVSFYMNEVADSAISSVDFTGATHVSNGYNCYLYKRPDGTAKLRYYDNSDVQQIVLPTA